MTRQMIYVFFGNRREASEQAHESPAVMTIPLILLAVCSIALSVVLTPAWPWLHGYLTGGSGAPERFEIGRLFQPMLFVSLALVAAGIGLGILIYRKAGATDPLARAQPFLFRFLENKMWLDELYAKTVLAGSALLSRASDWMDRHIWDGLARGVGGVGQVLGILSADFDERGINAGVDESATGTRGLGRFISARHSGQVQTYMGIIAVGMLALLILYAWLT
jgi:NADH-quinone oxidoreductase subunit L